MKILFLNHNYENFGTFYRCYFLGKYLARMGHTIDLVCASKKLFDLTIRKKEVESNFNIITLPRIRFHEYHTGHTLRALINTGIVMFKKYDVLHSFAVAQPATAIPTVVAKILKDKPIFVDWDDAWGGGFAESHPSLINKVISYLEKNVPKTACNITVVSEFLRNKCMEYGYDTNRIVKIPNGSNIDEIKPFDQDKARKYLNINKNDTIILSMGHTYMDTIDLLLDAFSLVLQKERQAKLYLVGNIGSAINNIKNRVSKLSNSVVITGEKPFSLILYYLSAANVLVLPMKDSNIEKARFPIRFGDYMASGKPIVSNAVGEIKNIIESEKCGLTCTPNNPEEFSEIVLKVIKNKELQIELGKQSRKSAEEKYAWPILAKQLDSIYKMAK